MFDTKDLEAISQEYFNIICTSEYDVTVQSKNTGHFWYLHNVTQPNANACVIFHKHKYSHPYHCMEERKHSDKQSAIYKVMINGYCKENTKEKL